MKADHTLGTTLDDAVSTNATGTISGKLRGLVGLVVTLLSRLPASLGQKAKAASFPVTLASDEDALTVTASGTVTADQGAAGAAAWPVDATGQGDVPITLDGEEVAISSVALPSAVVAGQKAVTSHGTAVALGASTPLTSGVRLKALVGNTGDIYVGGAAVASDAGFVLDAGEEVFVEIDNLASVYIDSSVDAEGVSYIGG
jgi:hypothetical protein